MDVDEPLAELHEQDTEIDSSQYRFVKRAPQRPFGTKHDVFVSSNSQFIAAVKRVEKMLKKDPYVLIPAVKAASILSMVDTDKKAPPLNLSSHLPYFRSSPVTLHGMGSAILKTVDIANFLVQSHAGTLQSSTMTSTMPLVDDYEPIVDGLPPISQVRLNSAIHITLTPTATKPK